MPKGYIIARITVTDPEVYKDYVAMASAAMKQYGGKPIAAAGAPKRWRATPGPATSSSSFESYDAARTYYYSPEYQAAVTTRAPASIGELVLVEGAD